MPPPSLLNSSAYCWLLLLVVTIAARAVLATRETPPTTKTPPPTRCTYADHACSNGRCVPLHRYCDGRDDCGDGSDEPRYCTKCNRTYYGVVGKTYDLELHRPKEDKIPFICHLTFTAAGGQFGDLIQVTFDSFTLGRFVSFTGDGCPDGSLQIVESGRPRVGGAWCGTTWGPAVYYSETDSVTLHVQLLKLSKVENGYNFDYRMEYKFLKRKSATVRYGGGVPSVSLNSSSPPYFSSIASSLTSPEPVPLPPEPSEPEPEYYLGDLISGTYCSRIFSDCDRKHCRLQSPNFPGIYPRNLTCYYAVRQHEIPPGKHALITVRQPKGQLIQIRSESALHGTASTHELRVWESCDDVQDYVVIYDGYTTRDSIILKFCGGGEPVPKTVSSGHELLVEFSTSPYGTFLQPSPPKSLHGFQLEVQVEFVDQQAPSYMRQKKNCEFWVRGTDKGVIESPVHSLPANTTCLYHFQGLDAAVSPSPVPYRPMNVRYPDWRHMGMILPPPRYRVWLSVVKFHAGGSWDPKQTEQVCRSYLNVWDGQLWTPSNCDGLYCGAREKPRGRTGSSIATGKKNVTLLARFCKERVPKSCEHSLLANDTRYPRPCSLAESFLTSGDSLTLELKMADSTALRPVTFKALYEFVDLHVDGEPFGDGPCSRKFGYTTNNKIPEGSINSANEEDRQQKFRSPRDVFLYGRGGARNLSCVYRFESPPDLRVKLTLTSVIVLRRRCETRASGGRLECVGEMTPSATVSLYERPWPDVPPVERHCLCNVRSQTLLPFTYVSTSNVVEIRFNVVGMNASDDFDTLSFEGTWKFIKTPSCSKELKYKGASGQLIFTHPPHHTEANCESNPRVIVPSPNKYLYVKIKGLIMKHSSRMGNNTIRTVNTGQRCDIATRIIVHTALYTAVICPTPNSYRDHLVEVFSEGWHLKSDHNHVIIRDLAFDKIEIDKLGKELPRTIAVEFYGKEEGEYVVNWLELTRRRDIPPNGLSLFLMKTDDCRYRCPELDACISPSVWCDGIEDCPSGVDEALSHCSLLLNLPPLYLALGVSGMIVAFVASVLMIWRSCKRRRPRSILQTRLKSLSTSDTGIVDEKGIIC